MRRELFVPQLPQEDNIRKFVEARLNAGMITTIDPADIPTNAVQEAKGVKLVYDRMIRSPGTIQFGPTKPNSNRILGLYSFKQNDGVSHVLRFTSSTVHKQDASWTALTGTLTGSDNEYFSFTFAFNKAFFANGVDPIQAINTGVTSFANLGNAPKYKYVAAFYNRIIGANLGGVSPNPYLLGCSGDLNFTEWDPLVDFTAAEYPLIESPSDTSDPITGLHTGPNYLIILKEKTIWLATKIPSGSNPLFPFTAVPDYGCDAPYANCRTPYGLVFLNLHDKKIYLYQPSLSGQTVPNVLSTPVEGELFKTIHDLSKIIASYNGSDDSVSFIITGTGTNTVRIWTYSFISKGWSYDERDNISYIADIYAGARFLTIGELVGTIGSSDPIATIGSAGTTGSATSKRLYGYKTGDIAEEDVSRDTDVFGGDIMTALVSKKFNIPTNDIYVVRMRFEFDIKRYSAFQLYWSKDGVNWKLAKTFTSVPDPQKVFIYNKVIKTRKIQWKLISVTGAWDIIDYEIHVYDAGISK
jgi:hypothetical protein